MKYLTYMFFAFLISSCSHLHFVKENNGSLVKIEVLKDDLKVGDIIIAYERNCNVPKIKRRKHNQACQYNQLGESQIISLVENTAEVDVSTINKKDKIIYFKHPVKEKQFYPKAESN